jgi:hypothetical protein
VDRSLASNEAAPGDVRAHFRQAILSVVFGITAWVLLIVGFVIAAAAVSSTLEREPNVLLGLLVFVVLLPSPLLAVLGIGQGAAAIRARGDHMILASAGLILSGLQAGVWVGMFCFSLWQN